MNQTRREKEEARLTRELLREKLEKYVEKQGLEKIVRAFTTDTFLKLYYYPGQDRVSKVWNYEKRRYRKNLPERYKLLDISKDEHFMEKRPESREGFLWLRRLISLGYIELDDRIEDKIERVAKHFDPTERFSLENASEAELEKLRDEIYEEIKPSSVDAARLYCLYSNTPVEFWREVPLSGWVDPSSDRWRFERKHSSKTLPELELFRRLKEEKPAELTAVGLGGSAGGRNGWRWTGGRTARPPQKADQGGLRERCGEQRGMDPKEVRSFDSRF